MLKLKQYLCLNHDFITIASHEFSQQNLWQCKKCKVFLIQHYGINLHYLSKTPHLEHWIYLDVKVKRTRSDRY